MNCRRSSLFILHFLVSSIEICASSSEGVHKFEDNFAAKSDPLTFEQLISQPSITFQSVLHCSILHFPTQIIMRTTVVLTAPTFYLRPVPNTRNLRNGRIVTWERPGHDQLRAAAMHHRGTPYRSVSQPSSQESRT